MQKFYDKNGVLLHQIHRKLEFERRKNLSGNDQFLQCASIKMNLEDTFIPHKHVWKDVSYKTTIAQESWVVIQGSVKVFLYDLENKLIAEEILQQGDASFTFQGGHNYLSLENDTLVYEFKTGPYEGVQNDKKHF